jgi:hypothetical protein
LSQNDRLFDVGGEMIPFPRQEESPSDGDHFSQWLSNVVHYQYHKFVVEKEISLVILGEMQM